MRLWEDVRFNLVARCSVLLPCNLIKTCTCVYSVSQKKVAPLKLFAIFSLTLSIFP